MENYSSLQETDNLTRRRAFRFIVLMGVVSLFGDITYESARSISGPYLAFLGAGAAAVSFFSGVGEFLGYALRLVSGYLADRTQRYWPLTIAGYAMILAIPLLAFAGRWELAVVFLMFERIGKAIRSPARDAILSHATHRVGRGWGFGIHEALDQIGAVAGPLLLSAAFLITGNYRGGFLFLFIPALAALAVLVFASRKVPEPTTLESAAVSAPEHVEFSRPLWAYTAFVFLSVMGLVNFPLLSFHFVKHEAFSGALIPMLYAGAMGVDGIAALAIGKLYDRAGMKLLLAAPFLTLLVPALGFSAALLPVIAAVLIWGVVMGIHETIMRAAIADLTHLTRRGTAYGIFNTVYGLALFGGGAVMGYLYDVSPHAVTVFTLAVETLSLPAFFIMLSSLRRRPQE